MLLEVRERHALELPERPAGQRHGGPEEVESQRPLQSPQGIICPSPLDQRSRARRFDLSVEQQQIRQSAEVGQQDLHQGSIVGVAVVCPETRTAHSVLSKILDLVRSHPTARLIDFDLEV